MSSAFEKFKESYFRHPNRDGPDLAILDQLDNSERKNAERLLLRSLTLHNIYAIEALGYLRSQQAFAPLVELLSRANGIAKVYIAQALWRIEKYEPALLALCQVLTRSGLFKSNEGRVEAAIALGEIAKKPSIAALKAAMNDRDYSVSYHARKSLAVLLGLQEKYEILEQIIMTGTSSEQQDARQEQYKLIENALDNFEKQL